MTRLLTTTALLLVVGTGVAQAYSPWSSDIERREAAQERRIEQGIRNGSLTREEARRLNAQQSRIDQMERNARRDGFVSPREAAEIRRAQASAGRSIYRETHDGEGRGRHYWRRWW